MARDGNKRSIASVTPSAAPAKLTMPASASSSRESICREAPIIRRTANSRLRSLEISAKERIRIAIDSSQIIPVRNPMTRETPFSPSAMLETRLRDDAACTRRFCLLISLAIISGSYPSDTRTSTAETALSGVARSNS